MKYLDYISATTILKTALLFIIYSLTAIAIINEKKIAKWERKVYKNLKNRKSSRKSYENSILKRENELKDFKEREMQAKRAEFYRSEAKRYKNLEKDNSVNEYTIDLKTA